MKFWMLVTESVVMVVLWVTCLVMDIALIINIFISHHIYLVDGITLLFLLLLFHLIINGWLARIAIRKCSILDFILILMMQFPLYLFIRGAWHGLQATCVQGQRHKMHRALKGKFALCCEVKSSSEKLPVEELEHREASCISSQNGEIPDIPVTTPTREAPEVTSDAEQGTETPVTILTTKFVGDTNKIELSPDNSAEIYGGEPSVYKYTIRCLQALFADRKRLSYHFVTDSTNTRILHVSCTDKRIGSLPDHVINKNPRVICSDTHYILNLSRINGHEVYDITKRSGGEVTVFVLRDLTKLIWIPIWPMTVIKMYDMTWKFFRTEYPVPLMWGSLMVGLLTWLMTQRALYHSITDRLLIAGHRISFYLVRTILMCGVGIFKSIFFIPICYLCAKAAGALFFTVYIAFMKKTRNVELFIGAFSKYTFYAMYDPVVQIGESLAYCGWAISLYCSHPHTSFLFHVMLLTIIGQCTGLVWILFARPRLRQPLHDPTRVLDLIKQMEYARL